MNIEITVRNFSPSEELKTLINEKILYLKRFDSNIDYARVVLLKESRAEKVELIISSKKNRYVTKCYSSVFEKTLALAIDNIKIQIRKKRKI
jgi:ribosome-associated translation inhibitor RaiA